MNSIGLNILGDRGMSNDNIAAYTRQLKPHTCVVINNNKLAAMLLSQGITVIYRHKSDQPNGNDDDALKYDPIQFVMKRNLEAHPGAIIHLTNEPGTLELSKLNDWTLQAMRYCDLIGRKACILNLATGNPEKHHWEILMPSLVYAADNGHIIGHHDYFDLTVDRSLKYHVGRAIPIMGKVGGKWAITELGCAVGYHPERGWQGGLSQEAYSLEILRAAQIYWLHNVPVCVYSYGSWHNFGIEDASLLKMRLIEYSNRLPVEDPSNARTFARVNLRSSKSISMGNIVRVLNAGTPLVIKKPAESGGEYPTGVGTVKRNDWYEVLEPANGWIAASFVGSL